MCACVIMQVRMGLYMCALSVRGYVHGCVHECVCMSLCMDECMGVCMLGCARMSFTH